MTETYYKRLADLLSSGVSDEQLLIPLLQKVGFEDWLAARDGLYRLLEQWPEPRAFAEALPGLLHALGESASADRALINLQHLFSLARTEPRWLNILVASPRTLEMLTTIFAGSQFLTDILLRNPDYLLQLQDPRLLARPKSRDQYYREAMEAANAATDMPSRLDALRRYQRLQLWRIGSSDLCSLHDLVTITAQLSTLSMALISACLTLSADDLQMPEDGFAVLALGKLGGRELNYSSDIDLLFVSAEADERWQRLGRRLIDALGKFTGEGFLYRIDMRLRPWGNSGLLVPAMADNLAYIRENARTWEKQAMLKARVVAGDRVLGSELTRAMRKIIFAIPQPELLASVVDMKQRIEKKLLLNNRDWREVKSGKGSIRDIEFVVQYLQLLNAAEKPEIYSRNTLDALGRLAAARLVSMGDYRILAEGYAFLRTVEHYLQIMHYQQTHELPVDSRDLAFLARRLGFSGEERGKAFLRRQQEHRAAIRRVYERIIGTGKTTKKQRETTPPGKAAVPGTSLGPDWFAQLAARLSDQQLAAVQASPLPDQCWQVAIAGYDYVGELSLICGLLSAFGMNIIEGQILTFEALQQPSTPALPSRRGNPLSRSRAAISHKRKIADVFTVRPMRNDAPPIDWQEYERELVELIGMLRRHEVNAMHGKLARRLTVQLKQLPDPPELQLPANIEIDNAASAEFTVLRIDAPDTFAFLYELTNALSLNGVNINKVKITSLGQRIHDTLYVTTMHNQKITDPRQQDKIRAMTVLVKHFTHLLPHSPNPEAAMLHFREFIAHFFSHPDWPAELASLERPEVFNVLVRLLGISDFLWGDFLRMQHDNLFPILRDVHGLTRAKSTPELQQKLMAELQQSGDVEERRVALNLFKDREMFRIDMRYIEGFVAEFWQFSEELTDLAAVVLEAALELCMAQLTAQFGMPMRRNGDPAEICVAALGKFGGFELGFASDIELMVVHTGDGQTTGPRQITSSEFFDRLVLDIPQTIRAKREGIFEIDMRLRPYGKAGRMAVALPEFRNYFAPAGAAWNYERQALVKLRPIWGSSAIRQLLLEARDACVYVPGSFDAAAMRAIREKQIRQLVAGGSLNAKYSPGGLVDLEYLVQGLQMRHGVQLPQLRHTNTGKAMKRLFAAGIIDAPTYASLKNAHVFLRSLIEALRMVRGNARDLTVPAIDSDEFVFLSRRLGYPENYLDLQTDLQLHTTVVRETSLVLLPS